MRYLFLLIVLIGLVSCEEKVEYNDEYKYSVCLKVLEKSILTDSHDTFIINPEIKDFRYNDIYISMYPERKKHFAEPKSEDLKEMGLSLNAYKDALYLNTVNSFNLNKLQKHNRSKNVVRLSFIRNNLIFMDLITHCNYVTIEDLKNENNKPVYSITSFFIQIDDSGNATYQIYNSLDFLVPCQKNL